MSKYGSVRTEDKYDGTGDNLDPFQLRSQCRVVERGNRAVAARQHSDPRARKRHHDARGVAL